MIDQKTINREYPVPHPDNLLEEDVSRIKDSFEKIDIDVNDLYGTTTQFGEDAQTGTYWFGDSTGTGTAYLINLTPSPTNLVKGMFIHIKAHVKNSGPATVDVNSLGVKNIKKIDGSDLKQGDIPENGVITLVYDGTNFQLANSAMDKEQTGVNASNIMRAFEEIQENHGGALLMEAGWSDSFSYPDEQGADEASSSGYQHDVGNKFYKGTDPGLGLISNKDYDTDANFLQQEWTNSNQVTSQATVADGSVALDQDTASTGEFINWWRSGEIFQAQSLTPSVGKFHSFKVNLRSVGSPTHVLVGKIYAESGDQKTGSALYTSNTYNASNLTGTFQEVEFIFTGFTPDGVTKYVFSVEGDDVGDVSNYIQIEGIVGAATFSGGVNSYDNTLSTRDLQMKTYFIQDSTATISSGVWPTNCENGRISFDSGSTWFDITSRNSDTQITHKYTTSGTSDYIIRMSEFDSNSVKLNGATNTQSGITIQSTRPANFDGYVIRASGAGNHATGSMVIADAIPVGQKFTRVDIVLKRIGSPSGNLFMKVYGAADTNLVDSRIHNVDNFFVETSSNTIAASSITTSNTTTKYTFYFSGSNKFELNKNYFFMVGSDTSMTSGNEIALPQNQTNVGMQAIGQAFTHSFGDDYLVQLADFFNQIIEVHTIGDGYPTSEYVSICDSESKKTNTSGWLDINSGSVTEVLNKENTYYWLVFDPATGFGDGTEIKIGNYSTGATTIDGNTSLDTKLAITTHVYVDRTIAVENNKWITHIGLKMEYATFPLTSIKIFRENSTSDFDVLYTQDIAPYDNSATTPWYELTTPFLTPATGTLRIGAFYSYGAGNVTLNNEDATSGNSYYWNDATNLAVGNHSGSWTASTNRLVIGYKSDTFSTGWRTIAKKESNVWKYNNSTSGTTYTPVTATTNDMLHAISEALSSQPANRMSKVALTAMGDSNWETTGGWSTSIDNMIRGVTFHSNDPIQTSSISQYRLNYDSERNSMDLRSKAYDPDFVPTEGYVWSQIEHSDSDGPGTFYVSRNGGTEWAPVPMAQQGLPLSGDIRIYRGTIDVSGQTSGQDLRCRYETESGKDQFLHSWGLQAKS
jgi:hypothetical protein